MLPAGLLRQLVLLRARGSEGGGWGAAGVSLWGRGCPVFLPPVWCSLAFGGFNLLWPVAVCAGGPSWAWGEGFLFSSSVLVTNALEGCREGGCFVRGVVVAAFRLVPCGSTGSADG